MKTKIITLALATIPFSTSLIAASQQQLEEQLQQLQTQTKALQKQIAMLNKQVIKQNNIKPTISATARQKELTNSQTTTKAMPITVKPKEPNHPVVGKVTNFHETHLLIRTVESHPESISFYPTALVADNHVVTYIAGTPIVTSPYLGARPAFDGSDYIVNISSINRDIRLMQQRRRLFRVYEKIGYPAPNVPILAVSGKTEPVAVFNRIRSGNSQGDFNLGSSELDVAAVLNKDVEGFISIAYDETPPDIGPRVANSVFSLNLGFVNIGDLDKSPFYFTAGQLYAPYGRYASSMISAPLTMSLARTKTRPVILGYKSQQDPGSYAAAYGFISDTTLGHDGVGGINLGYIFSGMGDTIADVGVGLIGSLADSQGMQINGSPPLTTFGGFGSLTNGTEQVRKVPGLNIHGNLSFDRYNLTAEWVGASHAFRQQDLSFNGHGAKPQAIQLEAGVTFKAFDKPATLAVGYQGSKEALALNLPRQRFSGVFNISIWKDTVESIEYRHDTDYSAYTYANGAAPSGIINASTLGTGKASDTVVAQVGVYF